MVPHDELSDSDLVARLEDLSLAPGAFRHREHVRAAFAMLRDDGLAGGGARFRRALRRFADHCGASRKYDEALTTAWLARLDERLAGAAYADSRAFLAAHPDLLDTRAVGPRS